jgi:hypothetical protein
MSKKNQPSQDGTQKGRKRRNPEKVAKNLRDKEARRKAHNDMLPGEGEQSKRALRKQNRDRRLEQHDEFARRKVKGKNGRTKLEWVHPESREALQAKAGNSPEGNRVRDGKKKLGKLLPEGKELHGFSSPRRKHGYTFSAVVAEFGVYVCPDTPEWTNKLSLMPAISKLKSATELKRDDVAIARRNAEELNARLWLDELATEQFIEDDKPRHVASYRMVEGKCYWTHDKAWSTSPDARVTPERPRLIKKNRLTA